MYVDAGFAGDLTDSKSTGGSFIYLVGTNTCVPIAWTCKKQGAVSHSSTEAEIISLDMGIRMQGIPALNLWENILHVMNNRQRDTFARPERKPTFNGMYDICMNVDYVPNTLPNPAGNATLVVLEDNDAVIKMLIKGRTDKMRHVSRTHRIDLDWLFDVMRNDPGLRIKYINTKSQVADMFTKGNFTSQLWQHLVFLSGLAPTRLVEKAKAACSVPILIDGAGQLAQNGTGKPGLTEPTNFSENFQQNRPCEQSSGVTKDSEKDCSSASEVAQPSKIKRKTRNQKRKSCNQYIHGNFLLREVSQEHSL